MLHSSFTHFFHQLLNFFNEHLKSTYHVQHSSKSWRFKSELNCQWILVRCTHTDSVSVWGRSAWYPHGKAKCRAARAKARGRETCNNTWGGHEKAAAARYWKGKEACGRMRLQGLRTGVQRMKCWRRKMKQDRRLWSGTWTDIEPQIPKTKVFQSLHHQSSK